MSDFLAAFLEKNDFVVVQQNGQRIIGPKGAEDSPTYNEIFLSQLPKEFKEEDIIPYLEQFPDICKIRTMLNFSGDCRGFCYIDFKEKLSALRACTLLDHLLIRNKTTKCTASDEDCRIIFVAFNWRTIRVLDMVWELLQEMNYITEDKTSIQKITVHNPTPHGLVHCFMKFSEHGKAASIRKHLRNKNKNNFYEAFFDWKKRCNLKYLQEEILEIYPDPDDMQKMPRVDILNEEKCLDYLDLKIVLV